MAKDTSSHGGSHRVSYSFRSSLENELGYCSKAHKMKIHAINSVYPLQSLYVGELRVGCTRRCVAVYVCVGVCAYVILHVLPAASQSQSAVKVVRADGD